MEYRIFMKDGIYHQVPLEEPEDVEFVEVKPKAPVEVKSKAPAKKGKSNGINGR